MAKITLTAADGTESRYRLAGEVFTIGRADDNDLVLNDGRTSSHHAVMKIGDNGEFTITDLGATNTTRVNGKPVATKDLKHGDTILIGDTLAIYESDHGPTAGKAGANAGKAAAAPGVPGGVQGGGCFALLVAAALVAAAGAALAAW